MFAAKRRELALDHDGAEHLIEALAVVDVCGHDERQWDTTAVHQEVTFASFFSPIRRVRADGFQCQRGFHHRPIDALPAPGDALHFVEVERSHGTDQREFYQLLTYKDDVDLKLN